MNGEILLLIWIAGVIAVGLYARRLNRSGARWGFLAIVLSPVLVLLLLMGLGLREGDEAPKPSDRTQSHE